MHKLESHMEEKTKFTNINLNQIILESMPGVAYIFNKEGFMVAWNKKVEETVGYSAEEIKNLFIREYPTESAWENVVAAVNDVYTKGYGQLETTLRTKPFKQIPNSHRIKFIIKTQAMEFIAL